MRGNAGEGEGHPAAAGWLTRGQVALRLGVAIATVRRFQGTRLRAQKGAHGEWLFDPAEVSALAAERTARASEERTEYSRLGRAELFARVFALLDSGRSFSALVQETALPVSVVRAIYPEWRNR